MDTDFIRVFSFISSYSLFYFYLHRKNRGNDLYKAKDYSGAIAAYSKAIDLEPSAPLLYTNRAAAYLMTHQFKETILDCDKAIHLDRGCAKAYLRKASALKSLGRLDEALVVLNAGYDSDPNNAAVVQERNAIIGVKNRLTELETFISNGNYGPALLLIDQLSRDLGTQNKEINLKKVECLLKMKRVEEAFNMTNSLVRIVFWFNYFVLTLYYVIVFCFVSILCRCELLATVMLNFSVYAPTVC